MDKTESASLEKNAVMPLRKSQLLNSEGEQGQTRQVALPPATTARQGCWGNIYVFVANVALLNLSRIALKIYYTGTIRTIERRFGLRSTDTGFVHGINDIPHICLVLFFGYFGRSVHKPRVIAATLMFPAVAGYLYRPTLLHIEIRKWPYHVGNQCFHFRIP